MTRVVVIGAGVIGLSTAINIKQCVPEADVTIVADRFNQNTTSIGAGALIVPMAPGISDELLRKWGEPSMDHFTKLAVSEQSAESGAMLCMGVIYSPTPQTPVYHNMMLTFNPMPKAAAEKLHLAKYHCWTTMTIMVEMGKYMPWLMQRFKDMGGKVVQKRVQSMRELLGQCEVVVNCTGVYAAHLTSDTNIVPHKGQTMRVSAPWIKFFIQNSGLTDEYTPHIYVNSGDVVVGGIKRAGSWNTNVEADISKTIWDKTTTLWPPLKPAKVVREWAGLRPHREPPRVEKETLRYGDKLLKVVHNYGHGSTGVSLSWGTALHATQLVQEMIAPTAKL